MLMSSGFGNHHCSTHLRCVEVSIKITPVEKGGRKVRWWVRDVRVASNQHCLAGIRAQESLTQTLGLCFVLATKAYVATLMARTHV